MSDAHAAGDPVGSLGEEAVKLLSAVSTWAQDHAHAETGAPDDEAASDEHVCATSCQWCPLCQAAAAIRSASPELKEQLVTSGLALTAVARTLLESLAASGSTPRPAQETDVEHIDLDDDLDGDGLDEGKARPWD